MELLGYASIWLLARADPPVGSSALLDADRVDLRVLAPAAYYARYDLAQLEEALDAGVRTLGATHGAELSFRYDVLPERLARSPLPQNETLMELLATRLPLHGGLTDD